VFPRTLAELRMNAMSAAIREKEGWREKRKKADIVEKWRAEASQQDVKGYLFDYAMAELSYYEDVSKGPIEVSTVDGVWQADELIPDTVKRAFLAQVSLLEEAQRRNPDWHPGSNQQVLNLVHPSLYCMVNGRTPGWPEDVPILLEDTLRWV